MKKKIFTFFLSFLAVSFLHAQTWDGSASTDWNTPANWSTNAIPIASGNVIIPNTANDPVLANDVTIASLTMSAGSVLDFNGFTLTVSAAVDINGATLNNSNVATDINLIFSGNSLKLISNSTINDHVLFTLSGTGQFREGSGGANTFNGNAGFNINSSPTFYIGYGNIPANASAFNGNVT
ncbi:MAG TPA: hypothetical protein PK987_02090, partial [Ferruginibacter sp.]|nr:hypothetical protein [Ferruginibacter sp.]